MPFYDFQCWSCDHVFEARQAMNRMVGPAVYCPRCNAAPATRLIGAAPVVLKGSTWAKDGYSSPTPTTEKTP